MRVIIGSSRPLEDNSNLGPRRQPWIMVESSQHFKIPLEVFIQKPFDWSGKTGLPFMIELLSSMASDQIVLFTDAWDAFFSAGVDEIERKFLASDAGVLHAAEWNLFPSNSRQYGKYPPSPTRWRYINGGGLMGYAGALLEMLTAPDFWPPSATCNQMAYHHWLIMHPGKSKRDCRCEIFLTLADWGNRGSSLESLLSVRDGRIFNSGPGTSPCIVHAPGGNALKAAKWWRRLKESLGIADANNPEARPTTLKERLQTRVKKIKQRNR